MSENNKDTSSCNQSLGDNQQGHIMKNDCMVFEEKEGRDFNPTDTISRNKSDENNETSSSDGSGKSGSGRGYNADNSASDDQLSDDFSNDRKRQQKKLCNDNGDRGTSSNPLIYNDTKSRLSRNHDDDTDIDYTHLRKHQNDKMNEYHNTNVLPNNRFDGPIEINALSQLWCNAASAVVAAHYTDFSESAPRLEQLHLGSKVDKSDTMNIASSAPLLPQWNGIHISNPMDPRIDFSTLFQIQPNSQCNQIANDTQCQAKNTTEVDNTHAKDLQESPQLTSNSLADPLVIVDSYMRLMEVSQKTRFA
jgi:hypothetical protein